MKKFVTMLLTIVICSVFNAVQAEELMEVRGVGYALLTGYDIKGVRNQQDSKMDRKAKNSDFEVLQTQQIKEATRQAETRKKQDKRMSNALRVAVINEAQEKATENAIKEAVIQVLGADAFSNSKVVNGFSDIVNQSDTYISSKNFSGEVEDNKYKAIAILSINDTEFRKLLKNHGLNIHKKTEQLSSILVVMDEFFAKPSNLNQSTATKEVTTYKYNKDESQSDKEAYKSASANKSAYAGYYGKAGASSSSGTTYASSNEYKNKEAVFYQHLKEYAPSFPKAQGMNSTQRAFGSSLRNAGIKYRDSSVIKSKYFKGKPITADVLSKSAELAQFVNTAKNDPSSNADYVAIGFSYITDNGKSNNYDGYESSGSVELVVYSTVNSDVIAEETVSASAMGDSPDNARQNVAEKLGRKLGEKIALQIQNYHKDNSMYGKEYNIVFKGNFTPLEKASLKKFLQNVDGVDEMSQRSATETRIEYTINYSGKESLDDAIWMQISGSSVEGKFKDYTTSTTGNQIIFYKKGTSAL